MVQEERTRKPRILFVEDDAAIAGRIVRRLGSEGFSVELAADGSTGMNKAIDGTFDVLVLDLMLPDRDGFEILEAVRARTSAPIIVVSAAADLPNRLAAFDLGAIDFLPKPFWIEELVARIRLRLRLHADEERSVRFAELTVDLQSRRVVGPGGEISLQRAEFDVLGLLLQHPGRALTRAQIADAVLGRDDVVLERSVDAHIARIRKKLGNAGAAIETVWGVGYRFGGETR